MAMVPLANGISTSRSMNFELGFGVCLNRTKIILGVPAKSLIERSRSSTEYLLINFQIFLTLTLTLTPTLYIKNTVASLHPAALASVPYGIVLVRVRV